MKNRTMDLLKFRPFPELGAAVRRALPMILERWLEVVRDTLPAAHQLTLGQVRNSLPETMECMAMALESESPKQTKDLMDQAMGHGESRFDQNFALGELMIEYGLLRPILIEEITDILDRDITIEESQALNIALDVILRRSVTTYVNQQKQEIHSLVEARSKYLSFLSHDLRGNLNGVLLMMEVLKRDLATEEKFAGSLTDLEVMRRSILDTVATMDRFLHAERFRRGKMQVRPTSVDLQTLVSEVLGQFNYHARDKGLRLEPDIQEKIVIVSDRDLIAMVLQNLVGNAIKYAQHGAVRIIVNREDSGPHACRVSVADQGPGIEPERLRQLFHAFARGETHGQTGSGLGLFIAHQAAGLLGATLWAESTVGQGSTFHLDLPAQPPEAKDSEDAD